MSQCEGRPAQPQTHRSPEPWQQIHLLHDVVLLQNCKIANSILNLYLSDTYCFVFDSSAELYLQGAGAVSPQHLGQLRGGGGVEGVYCHGVGHGDAGLHALMMGWKFVGLFI